MHKVVQINTVYNTGSTGKITASIEKISKQNDVEMYVAYGRGKTDTNPNHMRVGNKFDFGMHVLMNFCGRNGFGSKRVTKRFLLWLDDVNPDLIHLHNIHGFYINIEMLFQYIKEKDIPVVWTLHDCWPFTGQCAYFDYVNCNKWIDGCSKCPTFRTDYPYSIFCDNSKKSFARKKQSFTGVRNLLVVTPSVWLSKIVEKSFLKEYKTVVIPNGINLDTFKRQAIETSERVILAVANIWDKRKGLNYILELSQWYNHTNGYKIVVIGLSKSQVKTISSSYSKDDVLPMQRTGSQAELVEWYNKAWVLVNPTLQDNYPTTNLEAIACGTPVITFNTGGSPEMIDDSCGIVVEKGNIHALREAIAKLDGMNKIQIEENCYIKSRQFDGTQCFERYIELYKEMCSAKSR